MMGICFEAILPGFFNRAVADGGRLLVNLTDDGWFGPGAELEQHLNATRLRAVETRRWLVRASGSGISAVVSPSGNVVQSIPYADVGTIAQRIEPREDVTLNVRFGDAPWIAFGAVLAVAARRKARSRRYAAI